MDAQLQAMDGPLSKLVLESNKCYVLDCGSEIYIRVGRVTQLEDRKAASLAAEEFGSSQNRVKWTHLVRVIQGFETLDFKANFESWQVGSGTFGSEDGKGKVESDDYFLFSWLGQQSTEEDKRETIQQTNLIANSLKGRPVQDNLENGLTDETSSGDHVTLLQLYVTEPHNSKEIQVDLMDSILRHCYVKGPKEFEKCTEGDDVFLYADVDEESNRSMDSENDLNSTEDSGEDDFEDEEEDFQEKPVKAKSTIKTPCSQKSSLSVKAVNTYRGCIIGLEKIGTKKIPDRARNKEIDEVTRFVMGALAVGSQCLGRCLYIHGVTGTGKTTTVLTAMKKLWAKFDAKVIQPYRFLEINGLKLA
ncbi:hypothetical protein SUGI_0097080 [Cryptomeria japonica]|nr:hypothetical protein SUGI_0097080 [Cryptomeria japonica]